VAPKPLAVEITQNHLTPDSLGSVAAPDAPGLGISINPDAVRRYLVDVEIKVRGKTLFASPEHI
jgi:L-alanine-DL-glutamate epimerase-like enolase superfamily enzyme